MTENTKTEETPTPGPTPTMESSTIMDLLLPFRVLVTPLRTFRQLAQKPAAKGLITLVALILVTTAATHYALATRIILTTNGQLTSLVATDSFVNWFVTFFASNEFFIALYWLVSVLGLILVVRFFSQKQVKLRSSLVILTYLFSVLIVLYAVRTMVYLALPPVSFETGSWEQVFFDDIALGHISEIWGPSLAYEFGNYFAFASFAWLVLLGVVAVKTMHDISWTKASLVSVVVFMFTLFLLRGIP